MNPKVWLTSTALVTTLAAGTVYFKKEENREKFVLNWNWLKGKFKKGDKDEHNKWKKVGHPDPYHIEDNSMVDEGAVYAVNYYNKKEEE